MRYCCFWRRPNYIVRGYRIRNTNVVDAQPYAEQTLRNNNNNKYLKDEYIQNVYNAANPEQLGIQLTTDIARMYKDAVLDQKEMEGQQKLEKIFGMEYSSETTNIPKALGPIRVTKKPASRINLQNHVFKNLFRMLL